MNIPLLQVTDVRKVYSSGGRTLEALKGVSIDIYKGEILSLLGVNGAGKTTLSSILATLHPATSGSVLYRGKSIYAELMMYRRALGYCPQRPNLDSLLNVEQNLIFAGRYFLMREDDIKKRARHLMEQFDLVGYAKSNVDHLSGGFKQRVLLARSLMHRPEIVILDEPTVGLDPHIRRQMWDKIRELKQENVTVLITTHYLDEAEVLSDRVCILDQGRVRLVDSPENLKTLYSKGTLEDVFLQLMSEEAQAPTE